MSGLDRKQAGLSLIDLLLLLAFVIVAFTYFTGDGQNGVRGKVETALGVSTQAALALESTCSANRDAKVGNNLDADFFYVPSRSEEDFLERILLGADCAKGEMVVVIWTTQTGAETDPVLELNARNVEGSSVWSCFLISGQPNHVPEWCRNEFAAIGERS